MKNYIKNALFSLSAKKLEKINDYYQRYKGESCYLVGDGVSIKYFDLGLFVDKMAIPCGCLPFHNDFEKLHVEHCLLVEPWWFYPTQLTKEAAGGLILNNIQKEYKSNIKKFKNINFFVNLSNYPMLFEDNVTYVFRDIPDKRLAEDFISKKINIYSGSFRASIFLAIYMGFSSCDLVGFDYTHIPSRSLHWYELGNGLIVDQGAYEREFLDIAKEFIDIRTITLDGLGNDLNHITYQDLFKCAPQYKENHEILSDKYLKCLASWPGYKIF